VPGSADVIPFRLWIVVADLYDSGRRFNNGWLEIPKPRMILGIALLLAAVLVMLIGLSTAERSVASGPTR
jgi:hypothetical protein